MANEKTQNLQNHVRFVPMYHAFTSLVFVLNLGWTIYHLVKAGISFETVLGVLMAVALLVLWLYARVFALTVQDGLHDDAQTIFQSGRSGQVALQGVATLIRAAVDHNPNGRPLCQGRPNCREQLGSAVVAWNQHQMRG